MRDELANIIDSFFGVDSAYFDVDKYAFADHLLSNNVIKPLWDVGDKVWVIDREDGEAIDISCIQFLAQSEGFIIGTAWINDLDVNGTIKYHINETQDNFGTDLKVYPDEDCFITEEEAEEVFKNIQ